MPNEVMVHSQKELYIQEITKIRNLDCPELQDSNLICCHTSHNHSPLGFFFLRDQEIYIHVDMYHNTNGRACTLTFQENMEEISKLHRSVGRGQNLGKDLVEKNSELRLMHQNMSKWRDDTAEKLAKKFKEEMSRELEK